MHVLTRFLNLCVPDDAHPLYNSAIELMTTYRDTTRYDILVQLTEDENQPYPDSFRDEVTEIIVESLSDIIHDHGMIVEGELYQLVKLGQSIKALTESPDLDCIENALTAFPDHPFDCMQRALEAHGGLDELEFSQIVKLVVPSCIKRLEEHYRKTHEQLEHEMEKLTEDDTTLTLEVMDQKKAWLLKFKEKDPFPAAIQHYIVDYQGGLGKSLPDLTSLLHDDIIALQPGDPAQAAKVLVCLAVLSDCEMSAIYETSKEHIETIYDDMAFIVKLKAQIDELSIGG